MTITGIVNAQKTFYKGADISFMQKLEDNGTYFMEDGVSKDLIAILKNNNINLIRIRLWHTPAENYDNLTKTISVAKRIKQNGMKFLLDFHYSDSWADPATQTKPFAWTYVDFEALKDSLYNYTKSVLLALKSENVLPDLVQIGNEISGGMLWDDGRVNGAFNTDNQWIKLAALLKKGIQAIREVEYTDKKIGIIIHTDKGGDFTACSKFFDKLINNGVLFDIIGLSYYPWWHGTLSSLENNLLMLSYRYDKDILIVETAYPWTLAWNDNTHNIIGMESQLLYGYPASVEGQKKFLTDEITIINSTPQGHGIGMIYWEPDWVSTNAFGSSWENLALFDFNNNLLNSISAFEYPSTTVKNDIISDNFSLSQNYPNPFNPTTVIEYGVSSKEHGVSSKKYGLSSKEYVVLNIYDILGRKIEILVNEEKPAGKYSVMWNASKYSSGIYYYELLAGEYRSIKKMVLVK